MPFVTAADIRVRTRSDASVKNKKQNKKELPLRKRRRCFKRSHSLALEYFRAGCKTGSHKPRWFADSARSFLSSLQLVVKFLCFFPSAVYFQVPLAARSRHVLTGFVRDRLRELRRSGEVRVVVRIYARAREQAHANHPRFSAKGLRSPVTTVHNVRSHETNQTSLYLSFSTCET